MKKIIIFGVGNISYAVSYYINTWQQFDVAAYTVDKEYACAETFYDKPLLSIDEVVIHYPPSQFDAFVAVGYQKNNRLRKEKIEVVTSLGYKLVNIVNPNAPSDLVLGENCFVASAELIQPGVILQNDVFIWSGAMVGHHSQIYDHCWVSGGAAIGGSCIIGSYNFIGIGAVLGHRAETGQSCILGAGTLLTKRLEDGGVLIAPETEPYRLNSEQFLRFSNQFSR